MRQRTDRKLSERAWEILFIPNALAQLNVTTFEETEQAYLRRPRWDAVVAVRDNFDSSPSGSLLVNHMQDIGEGWTVEAGADPNAQEIQNAVSNGGNALRLFRAASGPSSHAVRARGHLYDAAVAELTRVTLKADWLRQDGDESATLSLDLTDPLNEDPTVFAHSNGNYWVRGADGFVDTNFAIGQDGWETIELVLTWGTSASDKVAGAFDVFLSRDEENSLGALSRTLIADNIPVNAIALATYMDILISNQPGGVGDVVTYWDNISLRVDPMLDGDFNGDGSVDAGDYTVWRDGLGTSYTIADYDLWKNNFGASVNLASGFGAHALPLPVPEPTAAVLAAYCSVLMGVWRIRRRACRQAFVGSH